jgi:hypothetical protein
MPLRAAVEAAREGSALPWTRLLDKDELSPIVERCGPSFDDLTSEQREWATVRSLELVAHRLVAVPETPLRGAREDRETASDSAQLRRLQAVRNPVHLTTTQLDVLHLSVMVCTLCIHHYLEVLTRSVLRPRTASDARVTERHRVAGPVSGPDPCWLSSCGANYCAGDK